MTAPSLSPSPATPRVLIVDDDPAVREALKKVLEESGYTVLTAADGRQGILRLEEQEFQLLLLDLDLPEVSGWDIVELRLTAGPLCR